MILRSIDLSDVNVRSTPYKTPTIEAWAIHRLLLPRLRVPCWFFLQSKVEKLLSWARNRTYNLRSWFSVRCLWPLSHCTKEKTHWWHSHAIKKRTNTKLLIDEMEALFIGRTRISNVANEVSKEKESLFLFMVLEGWNILFTKDLF